MAFTYPPTGGGGLLSAAGLYQERIAQDNKPLKWVSSRNAITTDRYWGPYAAHATPIKFDAETWVSNFAVAFDAAPMGWPGGKLKVWIYEADEDNLPRTLVWTGGVIDGLGVGEAAAGGAMSAAGVTGVVLNKDVQYWIVSQSILEDGEGGASTSEEFNGLARRSLTGNGLDPMHSISYSNVGDLGFNLGFTPGGLYIDEIANLTWGDPAPATLLDGLNSGFYPTAYATAVFLEVSED